MISEGTTEELSEGREMPVTGEDFWALLDGEVLDCLACGRPMTPAEVGHKLGMSAEAAASLLTMLARDGRVRIASVELVPAGACR